MCAKQSHHHLLLQTASFSGDLLAAILLSDGKLLAVNTAKEPFDIKKDNVLSRHVDPF